MLTLFDKKTIDELMYNYVNKLISELDNNLKAVILYGSCARGDYEVGSDIDVFILVQDASQEVIQSIRYLSDKIDWNYDTLISNTIRSYDKFNKFRNDTLYMHILQEGKVYYGEI